MAKPKFSPNTPVRLHDAVCGPFVKAYKEMIEEHGATYAVNVVIADHLRSRGVNVPELETPREKISKGQAKRWKSVRRDARDAIENAGGDFTVAEVLRVADEETERRRELKRERDRRHRAKKKAAKQEETKS
jgi:hypothetical protein